MPVVLAALLVLLLIVFASVLLIPITLIQRYRAGTARRRARPWLATINAIGIAVSAVLFLAGAAFTTIWIPNAFAHAWGGLVLGMAIGVLGVALTKWDVAAGVLHYTPNRWLVLAITLAVTGRIAYGFWRSWQAWQSFAGDASWVAASGVAGSLAAGAVILGYYFVYWIGIGWRGRRTRH